MAWRPRSSRITKQPTVEATAAALDAFAEGDWGRKFPTVAAMWRRQCEQAILFFAYPLEVRKIIYTTNVIESMHMQLRNIEKYWKMSPITWKQAANQFAILLIEHFTGTLA